MTGKQRKTLTRIMVAAVLLILLSILLRMLQLPRWAKLLLYLVPYGIVGWDVMISAVKNIGHGQVFDEKFLMAVATIGAFALGEYTEGVAVMLFYQIGELFQSIAVGKSRKNIAALMDIRPDTANLVAEDGTVSETDPDDVPVGSVIEVNPGEKIPIDGVIIEGSTSLDTSALTGESTPRKAAEGDQVTSGCICLSGQIRIRTEKEFGESTVSKILDLVENSSMKKAKAENFISKFAKYYTPVVVYSAVALAVLPPVIRLLAGSPANWPDWITRALTFLVISCPCAVVVSVPLSFFGGIGSASRHGILVKGSNYLEALSDTKTMVFDKTGTLTKGAFEVTGIYPAAGWTKEKLLILTAEAESASTHPIAASIRGAFQRENRETEPGRCASDIEEIAGHGVKAVVKDREAGDRKTVYAGNLKLMQQQGISIPESFVHQDGTVVYTAADGVFCGTIVISDAIKPTSREAISGLKTQGIHTVMLTGDVAATASRVAGELGMDQWKAELLPADKVAEVEKFIEGETGNEKTAFVGDGINDAPVLARADIGIAMGGMGSDAAIEAADIVLMDDDPAKISTAMRISRKTLGIVHQNIIFAIGVKVICLVLGALGIASMWLAIFADVGVMILAVLNAARALTLK